MAAPRGTPEGRNDELAVGLLASGALGVLTLLGLLVGGQFTPAHVLLVFLVPGAVLAGFGVLRVLARPRRRGQRSRPRGLSGIGGSGGASSRSPS